MEQFAACPFKFFVHSGLRAEERKRFELDNKEQGTFQHDALACFHEQLRREDKRWRDITPAEARERMGRIAQALMASYRDGLLQASEESRFMARILTESLQDFVETLVGWMRQQYRFDPRRSGAAVWRGRQFAGLELDQRRQRAIGWSSTAALIAWICAGIRKTTRRSASWWIINRARSNWIRC